MDSHAKHGTVKEAAGVDSGQGSLAIQPKWNNENGLPQENNIWKHTGKEADCVLKSPQKQGSKPAKTTTGSKQARTSTLQSAECWNGQELQWKIPATHFSHGLVSSNAVFGKCAPNKGENSQYSYSICALLERNGNKACNEIIWF